MGSVSARNNPIEVQIYIAYHLCRFILGIICTLGLSALFLYVTPKEGELLLTTGTFLSILLAFLSSIFTYNEFCKISFAYKKLLLPIFEEAKTQQENKSKKGED